ncbi:MBL fold metallo-hydrolase [Altererythrobacter sp. KTW20L]|uniref:MBL fold metallo-hydrolase n=1 Tax=Altererythrobacter sp. KTW20L TaxID=2942210 RepID=UPI0020C06461|nr:MBL fold metallo-hydrolase [Altererythrobacter sp. KTW20L]MCL6250859.1 MBL fold metallo-hydrolase [Altererythrobacter sp. KTW20L]
MGHRVIVMVAALLAMLNPASAWAQSEAREVLEQAAEAMGGLERLQALDNVVYTGFGQRAYYQGGGNITGDPQAPMKWQQLVDVQRTFDFASGPWPGGRALYQERWGQEFPFAGFFGLNFERRTTMQLHRELLDHPLPALLAALHSSTTLGQFTQEDGLLVVPFTLSNGGTRAWLAIDPVTHLPRFSRWVSGHANLGDLTTTAWYSGYLPFAGVQLPMGLRQELDWRRTTNLMFQVDSYRVNVVPEHLPRFPLPMLAERTPPPQAQVTALAPGVWDVRVDGAGGPVMEFADRLVMFEAYGGGAQTLLRIDAANELVPGKRVEAVIVSHHHFDHTGGLRAAVSRGLEVISHRGNEGIIRDMATRPAMHFPDALARNPQVLQFTPVDDVLVLEDAMRRLEIYRVIEHGHMPDAVFAYLPAERLMMEGDLGDEAWQLHWWGSAYRANIAHRGIDPARNVAVHGTGALSIDETLANTRRQIAAAVQYCATAEGGGRYVMGCPVQYDVDGPVALVPR